MSLFVSWVLFPLLLMVLALGCGLLLEVATGARLPGALVVPGGMAVIFVVTHVATFTDSTAELAVPLVLSLCIAGLALAPPWKRGAIDPWAVAVGVGVFVFYALPVVMTGQDTFTGNIKLDDTATWLAITDQLMEQGREVKGLQPSSFEATVDINLGGGYPWGAFPPLGVGHELMGKDSAWLFQPYLALLGSMLGLTLYVLGASLMKRPQLLALAAVVASQAALLFGYFLWGGIKEIAAAWLVAMAAATLIPILRAPGSLRAPLPLAIVSAALIGVLTFGGAAWLAPLFIGAGALVYLRHGEGPFLRTVGAFLVLTAAAALPSILTAGTFLEPSEGTLTSETDLGNLFEPLKRVQAFGIWPIEDFRLEPDSLGITYVLIAIAAVLAVAGVVIAWRRQSWVFLLYVASAVLGGLAISEFASPWVGGKALATASPALLFAALVGSLMLFEEGRRVAGGLAAAVIIGGVLWSNALAYQGVTLAPRDRMEELEQIGERIDGQGPALMTEYEPYGVRHFLRKSDAEGASELRRSLIPLRTGQPLNKIEFADIDDFDLEALLTFRTLVLRRSPLASRPPSPYVLTRTDDYYETWQLAGAQPEIVEHLPLGEQTDPTGIPRCSQVRRLAERAGPGGRLAAVQARSPVLVLLGTGSFPQSWKGTGQTVGSLVLPDSEGTLTATVRVPAAGRYGVWMGGAFRGDLEVRVDGRPVASRRHKLSHSGHFVPFDSVELTRGEHRVELRYGGKDLQPGSGGDPFAIGPLAFSSSTADRPVTFVQPRNAQSLCGQRLDWIEALR